MKKSLHVASHMHLPLGLRTLISASIIASLTACGGDTLDSIQNDLANGDDINLTLSTNDDGDLVIGIDDGADQSDNDQPGDDDPSDNDNGGSDAPTALFDEAIDGEITDDPTNPLALDLANGSNVLNGTVVAGDIDYVTVHVPAGHVLSALDLLSFESEDNLSFVGIQEGTVFTEPPVDTDPANLLGFILIGEQVEGTNLLPAIGAAEGAQGFTGPLPAGDYTFWIQQTTEETVDYSLDMIVSPVSVSYTHLTLPTKA